MNLLKELFSNDIGLLSAGVIAFTIVMAVYFAVFFSKKMREDSSAG